MLLDFVGPESEWQQKIAAQLDSSINEWAESVPDHRAFPPGVHSHFYLISHPVRWDPKREDITFFQQSSALWSAYYETQIGIHRSFLSRGTGNTDNLPSLAICLNAARACSRIIEAHQRRKSNFIPVQLVRLKHLLIPSHCSHIVVSRLLSPARPSYFSA
jgi:hypothetical protein